MPKWWQRLPRLCSQGRKRVRAEGHAKMVLGLWKRWTGDKCYQIYAQRRARSTSPRKRSIGHVNPAVSGEGDGVYDDELGTDDEYYTRSRKKERVPQLCPSHPLLLLGTCVAPVVRFLRLNMRHCLCYLLFVCRKCFIESIVSLDERMCSDSRVFLFRFLPGSFVRRPKSSLSRFSKT